MAVTSHDQLPLPPCWRGDAAEGWAQQVPEPVFKTTVYINIRTLSAEAQARGLARLASQAAERDIWRVRQGLGRVDCSIVQDGPHESMTSGVMGEQPRHVQRSSVWPP